MQMTEVAETLDTSGLSCPLPILKTKKVMKAMNVGDILKVISTDHGSVKDMAAWVRMTGQEMLEALEEGSKYIYFIKKLK